MAPQLKDGPPSLTGFPSTTCEHTQQYAEKLELTVSRFAANQDTIEASCDTWKVARNTEDETAAIHESIVDIANATGVDSRFILATIMQTSDGCVRATTTHPNFLAAGLMQR